MPIRISPADEFINAARGSVARIKVRLTPDQRWRMHVIGPFGDFKVNGMGTVGDETILFWVETGSGDGSEIIAHISQCSVLVEAYSAVASEEPQQKVIYGFAEGQESNG